MERGFDVVKKEFKDIQKEISELRNKEYILNKEYTELLKAKCRENIGRCFKKMKNGIVISYWKVVDIDKDIPTKSGEIHFNEYQYPSLHFRYPYDGSKTPFEKDNLFSGAWGKVNDIIGDINNVTCEEITKEEFNAKFNEVNSAWVNKVRE
jgi:hypothetical protein